MTAEQAMRLALDALDSVEWGHSYDYRWRVCYWCGQRRKDGSAAPIRHDVACKREVAVGALREALATK